MKKYILMPVEREGYAFCDYSGEVVEFDTIKEALEFHEDLVKSGDIEDYIEYVILEKIMCSSRTYIWNAVTNAVTNAASDDSSLDKRVKRN